MSVERVELSKISHRTFTIQLYRERKQIEIGFNIDYINRVLINQTRVMGREGV